MSQKPMDRGPLDLDAARARYEQERDKRLRTDSIDQYIPMQGQYARFVRDPFARLLQRAPLIDEVEALIIGGGFSGLLAAARLLEAGIESLRIVERGGDFGGTWYWNRYPGAQCDVESYIYMPLLEEVGYIPKTKYSNAPEIFAHCQAIGRRYGLYDKTCFQTLVTELRWDDEASCWHVATDRGDKMRARFICLADGPLSQPKLPGIPGIETFKGTMFHTSRWDYGYTGGDENGGLDRLGDKRIGVIGTGATAIQCVPYLAEAAGHLLVFQRTPSAVFARDNRPTDAAWAATLAPGWQWARMTNYSDVTSGTDLTTDLVDDALTALAHRFANLPSAEEIGEAMERIDLQIMEELRAHVADIVSDPAAAQALKPWYRTSCKRPCFNDEYLQAFNRPNVELVDTDGKGVAAITSTGVIAGGQHHELDCLIFATGFEVGTSYPRRSGFEIFGRSGATLTQHWARGPRSLHGLQTHGFPNCFFLGITQGAYTGNFSHMLYEQSAHIAYVVSEVRKHGRLAVEVTRAAEDQWVDLVNGLGGPSSVLSNCTPGYYNSEGRIDEVSRGRTAGFYAGAPSAFFRLLAEWRDRGDLQGLQLSGTKT
jgi:cation diffusion facilitator CzcD-associated flavoprotein CzcO